MWVFESSNDYWDWDHLIEIAENVSDTHVQHFQYASSFGELCVFYEFEECPREREGKH